MLVNSSVYKQITCIPMPPPSTSLLEFYDEAGNWINGWMGVLGMSQEFYEYTQVDVADRFRAHVGHTSSKSETEATAVKAWQHAV